MVCHLCLTFRALNVFLLTLDPIWLAPSKGLIGGHQPAPPSTRPPDPLRSLRSPGCLVSCSRSWPPDWHASSGRTPDCHAAARGPEHQAAARGPECHAVACPGGNRPGARMPLARGPSCPAFGLVGATWSASWMPGWPRGGPPASRPASLAAARLGLGPARGLGARSDSQEATVGPPILWSGP